MLYQKCRDFSTFMRWENRKAKACAFWPLAKCRCEEQHSQENCLLHLKFIFHAILINGQFTSGIWINFKRWQKLLLNKAPVPNKANISSNIYLQCCKYQKKRDCHLKPAALKIPTSVLTYLHCSLPKAPQLHIGVEAHIDGYKRYHS